MSEPSDKPPAPAGASKEPLEIKRDRVRTAKEIKRGALEKEQLGVTQPLYSCRPGAGGFSCA